MTKKIYYEKQGRRYVPVYEYDNSLLDSFPKGNHLVMVYPGGSSRRYNIDPNHAAMIAAGRVAEDAISAAIVKAQELKPQRQPITEKQQKLWKALAKSFNQDDYPLIRPCAADAARAGVQAMIDEAENLMTNQAVRNAFEHFLMVAALSKKSDNDA